MKTLLDGRMRRNSHEVDCAVSALAWLAMLTCIVIWFTQPANAAEITFDRAYTGTIKGQTFTANGTLAADAGSINFDDGGTSRNFTNTMGTLKFTVAGVPTSLSGQLTSRHPQGGTIAEAVVFTDTGGTSYLLVLTGSYSATYSASGSANQILAGLNSYLSAFTADPGVSTILVDGVAATTIAAGANASVAVTAKFADGTPISGATVVLTATPSANSSITPATTTSDGTGAAMFTVTNSAAEIVNYQATVTYGGSDTLLTSTVSVTYTLSDTTQPVITGPNAATSAGTGTDGTTIEAGTTAVASFTADEAVTWTLAGTDAALFEITTGGVLTLKADGVVGTYEVNITAEDADGNISVLTFTLTVERATYIEAEADKSTGIANSADAVEITVTLTDENNLPVIGKAVELTTDFGTLFINPSGKTVLTRDNGDGTYTAFLRSEEPGEATITITIDEVDHLNQLFVEFILIDETGSSLSASPSEIRANGLDTSQITVFLYDADGSLLPSGGDTVTLVSTLGTLSAVMDNGDGTYSATLTASTEVGVATVSGTVNGIAIAAPTTVRFAAYQQAVRDAFTDVTSAFIHRRMDRILSAEPRSHHLDRRREATSGPQFSLEYQRNSGELASRLQLAGQLGDMPRGSLDITGSEANPSSFLRFSGNASSANRNWYFWTEGQYSAYQDATGNIAQRDGGFGIVFLGVDYLVNQRLSFGVMAHADRASARIDSYSEVSGNGWMVGPYLSAEVAEDLFFSGRVAWGQSRNSTSIDVFSDNTEWLGDFGTERFLARGALYGSYEMGRARLMPQVDLAYMREQQKDYVVSDGVSEVSVAGVKAKIGRLTFSTEVEWPIELMVGEMNAFVIPRLDWDFHTSASNDQRDQTRGSLEFGLRTTPDAGWSGEAAVRYDGIGQSGFNAWNMRFGAQIDF